MFAPSMTQRIFLSASVATFLLAGTSGCSGRVDASPTPPVASQEKTVQVDSQVVEEAPMARYLELTGTLAAHEDSDVAAGAQGKVVDVLVERGSLVKKGQAMVRLDSAVASAVAAEGQAQVVLAQTQRELAEADCARNKVLYEKGGSSLAEHQRVQAQCRTAVAQAQAAEARARVATLSLSDTSIRAPFDGLVSERVVSVGEYVRPDSKVVTLLAINPLRLELSVPEASASEVKAGQKVRFTVTASPGTQREAQIAYVGPGLRKGSRDLVVEALVPNADRALIPGQFASARLEIGARPLPVVPATALRRSGGQSRLLVVANGQLEERVVQVAGAENGTVGVLSGLKAGERVVTQARDDLRDGQKLP